MYNLTRQQAADILGISTRSVDRYVKSGKIRAQKSGRVVLLNDADVKVLSGNTKINQKIIITQKEEQKININQTSNKQEENVNSGIIKKAEYEKVLATFDKMFSSFREEIKQKDNKIQELSIELGKIIEQKNNSVDLMEYKKVQFLSEETKNALKESLEEEKKQKENLEEKLKYEKTTNKFLIFFLVVLFIISALVFFINM